jgi:hypothetical protein
MPTIVKYIKQSEAFDPETLSVMGVSYESALKSFPTAPSNTVREVIATRIIAGARDGERDPDKLCQMALSGLAWNKLNDQSGAVHAGFQFD